MTDSSSPNDSPSSNHSDMPEIAFESAALQNPDPSTDHFQQNHAGNVNSQQQQNENANEDGTSTHNGMENNLSKNPRRLFPQKTVTLLNPPPPPPAISNHSRDEPSISSENDDERQQHGPPTPQKVNLNDSISTTGTPTSPSFDNESTFLLEKKRLPETHPNQKKKLNRSNSLTFAPNRKLNIFALIRKDQKNARLHEELDDGENDVLEQRSPRTPPKVTQEVRVPNEMPFSGSFNFDSWSNFSLNPNMPQFDDSNAKRRSSVPMAPMSGLFYSNEDSDDDDRPLNLGQIKIVDDTPDVDADAEPSWKDESPKFTFNLNDREVVLHDDDIETIIKPSAHSVYEAAADDESTSFRRIQHELDEKARRLRLMENDEIESHGEDDDNCTESQKIEMPSVSTFMERMVEGDEWYKEGWHQSKFVLSHFTEVPRFLRRPFILSSYRVQFSFKQCIQSIFHMHNETINIWTHLLSFIIFFLLEIASVITVIVVGIKRDHGTLTVIGDAIAISLYMTAACYCFFCSASYHCFKCKSKESYCTCYKMDISGVSNLIAASFVPGLWFLMRCHWILQTGYGLLVFILGLIGTMMPFSCLFSTSVFETLRTLFFGAMVLFSLLPSIHFTVVVLVHGTIDQVYFEFLSGFIVMVILYGIGFFFWITRIPERLLPGKFDIFLSSHQIWHVFISLAAFVWWAMTMRLWWAKSLVTCW